MLLIQVKLIEGVFTALQTQEIIERLTDAIVEIEGENMRPHTWCVVEEVASGEWGIGGRPLPPTTRRRSHEARSPPGPVIPLRSNVERSRRPRSCCRPGRPPRDPNGDPRPHVLDPDRLPDHIDPLYRAAWALSRSRHDAEGLVQETFLSVLARPRVLRDDNEGGRSATPTQTATEPARADQPRASCLKLTHHKRCARTDQGSERLTKPELGQPTDSGAERESGAARAS